MAVAGEVRDAAPAADEFSMRGRRQRRLLVNAARIGLLVAVIGGWELMTRSKILDPFFFGQPSRIATQLQTWVTEGTAQGPLGTQILVTMEETAFGFALGAGLGVLFGILLGRIEVLAEVVGIYIKMGNAFPRIVLGSIFVVWLGLGIASKVFLSAVLVFFPVFFNAFQGVREVDQNLTKNALVLGAGKRQLMLSVTLPSALSWITTSLHTSFGFALIGAVVGEYLGASQGLGLLIASAQVTFNPNGVFAAMFILGVVALTIDALLTRVERYVFRWHGTRSS